MNDMLNWLYPEEVAGTVWWVLGSAEHKGVELTITDDLTYEQGLYECLLEMKMLLHRYAPARRAARSCTPPGAASRSRRRSADG